MKRLFQTLLALFVSLTGIAAFYAGYHLLSMRGLLGAFAGFVFPGCIFFIFAGLLSMVIPFFTFKKTQVLNLIALQEGIAIVFIIANQATAFRKLTSEETIAAAIGIYLIVTAALLLLWHSNKGRQTKL